MSDSSYVVTYCRRWNFKRHKPIEPLTPAAAQARDKQGEEYAVILWANSDETIPNAVIEVVWHNNFASVWFFDEQGRRSLNYAFHPSENQLFLFDIIQYGYPNDKAHTLADACRTDHCTFHEDGTMREVVTDDQMHEKTSVDRRDVDVRSHWEPRPRFGAWDSLARWNRE